MRLVKLAPGTSLAMSCCAVSVVSSAYSNRGCDPDCAGRSIQVNDAISSATLGGVKRLVGARDQIRAVVRGLELRDAETRRYFQLGLCDFDRARFDRSAQPFRNQDASVTICAGKE